VTPPGLSVETLAEVLDASIDGIPTTELEIK
jgi:hypothetical protein